MRRMQVLAVLLGVALLVAGSATIRLPGGNPLPPPVDLPPAADAVLDAVRSVMAPVAPTLPGEGLAREVPAAEAPSARPASPPPSRPEQIAGSASPPMPAPEAAAARAPQPSCRAVTVSQEAQPASVRPGEQFTWVITVTNPNDRTLGRVTVIDTVHASPGVRFAISLTDPVADSQNATSATFDDVGPLGVGRSERVRVGARVEPGSAGGRFTNDVAVIADCPSDKDKEVEGATPLESKATLEGPAVVAVLGKTAQRAAAAVTQGAGPRRRPLSHTGGGGWERPAAVLLLLSWALRRMVAAR